MKINHINKGLAYRSGGGIYINKKLKAYPKLYKYVLEHESKHSSNGLHWYDLVNEFNLSIPKVIGLMGFMLKTPSTWWDLIPITKNKKEGWMIDYITCIGYGIIIILIYEGYRLLNL